MRPPRPSREAPGLDPNPRPSRRELAREATPLSGPPGCPRLPESNRPRNSRGRILSHPSSKVCRVVRRCRSSTATRTPHRARSPYPRRRTPRTRRGTTALSPRRRRPRGARLPANRRSSSRGSRRPTRLRLAPRHRRRRFLVLPGHPRTARTPPARTSRSSSTLLPVWSTHHPDRSFFITTRVDLSSSSMMRGIEC